MIPMVFTLHHAYQDNQDYDGTIHYTISVDQDGLSEIMSKQGPIGSIDPVRKRTCQINYGVF